MKGHHLVVRVIYIIMKVFWGEKKWLTCLYCSAGICFVYLPSLLLYSTVKGCVTAGGEGRCSVSANRGEVFFDFLMTPYGEGSEGMMGNVFSGVLVHISSQRKTQREWCSLKKVDLERKSPEPPAQQQQKKAIPFTRLKNAKHWTFNFLQLR